MEEIERDDESRVPYDEATRLAEDATLMRAAVRASGLSARRFAVDVLTRDERTVRRWLAGDSPLPKAVRDKCLAIIAAFAAEAETKAIMDKACPRPFKFGFGRGNPL